VNIHKPLCAGFRELKLQEVETRSCMIHRSLWVLPQPPAHICCSAPMTLFMRVGASQIGNWPYSFQSAMELQWHLSMLSDIRRYVQDRFLKVSLPSTDVKGKPYVLSCWSVLMLSGWPFCPGLSQVTKPRLTIISRRRNGSQQSPRKNKFRTTPSARNVMITVLWDIVGVILVDVMARGETTRTRTLKPSKNWNSFTGECGLTGIQKTC